MTLKRRWKDAALLFAIVYALGNLTWATAQQSIRIFGTTSTGTSRPILVNSSGAMTVTAASGSGYFPFVLTTNTTNGATAANTTETDLWTYSLPAGHLGVNGNAVRFWTYGTVGANANTKTIKAYFGATQCAVLTTTANASNWEARCQIIRTGATTQESGGVLTVALAAPNATSASPAETLANAITIKVTGQNGSAVANDVVFHNAIVESIK